MCSYHRAECDETDERVRGDQAQAGDQRLAKGFEILLIKTGVHHEQEDRRHRHRSGESVFDGGVFWKQLGREIGVRDVLVVRGEGVTRQAERTYPEFSSNVDLAVNECRRVVSAIDKTKLTSMD